MNNIKLIACAALFGLWTALVWFGHPDQDLIMAIKLALGGLGAWHAVENLQTVPKEPPVIPDVQNQPPTLPLRQS